MNVFIAVRRRVSHSGRRPDVIEVRLHRVRHLLRVGADPEKSFLRIGRQVRHRPLRLRRHRQQAKLQQHRRPQRRPRHGKL